MKTAKDFVIDVRTHSSDGCFVMIVFVHGNYYLCVCVCRSFIAMELMGLWSVIYYWNCHSHAGGSKWNRRMRRRVKGSKREWNGKNDWLTWFTHSFWVSSIFKCMQMCHKPWCQIINAMCHFEVVHKHTNTISYTHTHIYIKSKTNSICAHNHCDHVMNLKVYSWSICRHLPVLHTEHYTHTTHTEFERLLFNIFVFCVFAIAFGYTDMWFQLDIGKHARRAPRTTMDSITSELIDVYVH